VAIPVERLGALIRELTPALRGDRSAAEFLFDPATLHGPTRVYYLEYLRWLGIPPRVLPPQRVFIHADRPIPANLEFSRITATTGIIEEFSLYLDNDLFRSIDAVKMALAHELTHLYLVRNDLQTLASPEFRSGATYALSDSEEVRTEVASILLGFGKLVLNGASDYARQGLRAGYIARLGYISVDAFAYLYKTVNELVGVPTDVALHGLNPAAEQAISVTAPKRAVRKPWIRRR
jgi:hypothetical protein